jgi:tetratricopeptide (TPR) repeat protein
MVGRTILHYTITAELGAGAMGRVFLAHDQRTDRKVALKFIAPEMAANAEGRARLFREAAASARLSHPNVVALHAIEEAEGHLFLVEEFVEGESLAKRLERGPLGPQEVLRLASALASALAHAHKHGVLHRDLKPANVMLAADGTIKLADFGIARVEGGKTLTAEGMVAGTTAYMAPELLSGHRGDARADLFALGAVLYEALCGRRAFAGGTDAEVIYGVLNSEPKPPEVPTASLLPLAALVMKLLAKEPQQRPTSAEAVLEALDVMQPSGTVVLRRRRAWLVPAIATVAVLIVLALAFWARGRLSGRAASVPPAVAVLSFENVADPADPQKIGAITGNLLITSLAQAPGIQVLGTERILDAMRGLSASGTVSRGTALLIARRAHAARIVSGRILQVQPLIVLTAEISEVASGRVLDAARIEGEPGQTVFQVVDALGARLVQKMGRPDEAARLAPVGQRTSTDLEAQRRYAEGMERLAAGEFAPADSLFAAAVARDSSFAQAWYRLALIRWWWDEDETARADIRRARAHADRLTDLDRDIIEGLADLVEGRALVAATRFEGLAAAHPEEKLVLYGLEEARFHSGDLTGTIEVARRLMAQDPDFTLAGRHLMDALTLTGGSAEAVELGRQLLARSPRSEILYGGLVSALARALDADAILRLQREVSQTGFRPVSQAAALLAVARDSDAVVPGLLLGRHEERWVVEQARLGAAYYAALRHGRFREAVRCAETAWRLGSDPAAPLTMPWAEGLWAAKSLGDSARAMLFVDSIAARAGRYGAYGRPDLYRAVVRGVTLADLGDLRGARLELAHAETHLPAEGPWRATGLRTLRARLLESDGRYADALEQMKSAQWYGFPVMAPELAFNRAGLLEKSGRHAEALGVIDSLIRCPLLYPDDAVRLHLQRGQVLERLRRPAEAAAEYREFLRIWKDADPGRPEVAEARAALARLTRTGPAAGSRVSR